MKTNRTNAKHTEWLSAENMHVTSKKWLSQLQFYKDEMLFFEELITSFTLQILYENHLTEAKILIDKLDEITKTNLDLTNSLTAHINKLEILVDGVDEIKEEIIYREEHRNLIASIGDFQKTYQSFKSKLFVFITDVMKVQKQKRLIDKK